MNQKLKLLIVADTYYPKVDGTLKFIEEFMKRAQETFDISLPAEFAYTIFPFVVRDHNFGNFEVLLLC